MLQDVSKTLRRALRVWRSVQAHKRAGAAFHIENVLDRVKRYTLALRCPACPHPGVNMDVDLGSIAADERLDIIDSLVK